MTTQRRRGGSCRGVLPPDPPPGISRRWVCCRAAVPATGGGRLGRAGPSCHAVAHLGRSGRRAVTGRVVDRGRLGGVVARRLEVIGVARVGRALELQTTDPAPTPEPRFKGRVSWPTCSPVWRCGSLLMEPGHRSRPVAAAPGAARRVRRPRRRVARRRRERSAAGRTRIDRRGGQNPRPTTAHGRVTADLLPIRPPAGKGHTQLHHKEPLRPAR